MSGDFFKVSAGTSANFCEHPISAGDTPLDHNKEQLGESIKALKAAINLMALKPNLIDPSGLFGNSKPVSAKNGSQNFLQAHAAEHNIDALLGGSAASAGNAPPGYGEVEPMGGPQSGVDPVSSFMALLAARSGFDTHRKPRSVCLSNGTTIVADPIGVACVLQHSNDKCKCRGR